MPELRSYVLVATAEWMSADVLRAFALCSKGCAAVVRAERRRRPKPAALVKLLPIRLLHKRVGGCYRMLLQHVEESHEGLNLAAAAAVPGMSLADAAELTTVRVTFPNRHEMPAAPASLVWAHTHEKRNADGSSGSACGCGMHVGDVGDAKHFVGFAAYTNNGSGVACMAAVLVFEPGTGEVVDVYWAFRPDATDVVVAAVPAASGDTPFASVPSVMGSLAHVVPQSADGNAALDVADVVATHELQPFRFIQHWSDCNGVQQKLRAFIALATSCAVPADGNVGGAMACGNLVQHIEDTLSAPIAAVLQRVGTLYRHQAQFQQLTTPKGLWHCETGNSAVQPVDAFGAWKDTMERHARTMRRTWSRGTHDLFSGGAIPIGTLVTLLVPGAA